MKLTSTVLLGFSLCGLVASLGAATPQENWDLHCAKCHAADGSGNTKIGQKLKLKDYSKKEAQQAFTDEEALAVIRDGKKDAAGKMAMNPYAEKLSAEEMQALVAFVRTLAKG
ncbi:MAG: cytochrome c [Opitutaceae bacterium]